MKRILCTVIAALALAAFSPHPAQADQTIASADAAWGMVLDPEKVLASPLVSQVAQYFPEDQRTKISDRIDIVSNTLGLDLQKDLGPIVITGEGFNPDDISMAVDIGPAQTNIAGLMLVMENYNSYDHAGLLVHSAQVPGQPEFFCAVVDGDKTQPGLLLLSTDKNNVEDLVDAAQAGRNMIGPETLKDDEFFRLWVNRLPEDLFALSPRESNIVGMIESLELVGATGQAESKISLNLTLTDPARAQQIYQMAAGSIAFLKLAVTSDPSVAQFADLFDRISIEQPGENSDTLSIGVRGDNEGIVLILDMLKAEGVFHAMGL